MDKTPTCVNVKKIALSQRGYKCFMDWCLDPKHMYIGRSMEHYVKGVGGSKWQNSFTVKKYSLEKCLELYEERIRRTPELMAAIPELEGMQLGCWCNPFRCHRDILIKLFKEINDEKN